MMASKYRNALTLVTRRLSQQGGNPVPPKAACSAPSGPNVNVPGLTESCIRKATGPVGPGVDPGKASEYKVPEYFCYNSMTYYEAEIEMAKHRLPQPSALK